MPVSIPTAIVIAPDVELMVTNPVFEVIEKVFVPVPLLAVNPTEVKA